MASSMFNGLHHKSLKAMHKRVLLKREEGKISDSKTASVMLRFMMGLDLRQNV